MDTIEIILTLAFPDKTNKLFHGITKAVLKRFLIVCKKDSHLQFNGKYNDQIDGVAMGSPLGPLFANIFMSDFERKYMYELKKQGVIKWFRYVDDVLRHSHGCQQSTGNLEVLEQPTRKH
jgi:hypothetical protein